MSNVIAFPRPVAEEQPSFARNRGSQTLFIHIKRTTLIAYLAAEKSAAKDGDFATTL